MYENIRVPPPPPLGMLSGPELRTLHFHSLVPTMLNLEIFVSTNLRSLCEIVIINIIQLLTNEALDMM